MVTVIFSGVVRKAVMQMAKQAVMQASDNQSHNSSLGEPPGSSEGDGWGWHDLSWLTSLLRGSSLSSPKCFKNFLSNFHNECQCQNCWHFCLNLTFLIIVKKKSIFKVKVIVT